MQRGVQFEERDFFQTPFSREEIEGLLHGRSPREMFNARSLEVKKRGLMVDKLSEAELLALMREEPRLIKRPIVTIDDRTYFGADVKNLSRLFG